MMSIHTQTHNTHTNVCLYHLSMADFEKDNAIHCDPALLDAKKDKKSKNQGGDAADDGSYTTPPGVLVKPQCGPGAHFSNVLSIVTLHSDFTGVLTF